MYEYAATLIRIIGPLSLHLDIDLGFNVHTHTTVRLDALRQPEPGTARRDATAFVQAWLGTHQPITVRSLYGREKYGRWLVIVTGEDGAVLNSELLTAGLVHHIDNEKIADDEAD